jgi:uncharacterized protein YbjQ (UPF0145 family)
MSLNASLIADFSSFMDATREAIAAMGNLRDSAGTLGPSVDKGLEDTTRKYMELGAKAREVGSQIIGAAQPFIEAFQQEEDAVNRLTTALQATGQATPEVINQYAALATQFQNTTKYADEAVTSAQAVLTTIGKVGPENMELALTATTNLASALKIDLGQAATIVGNALGSSGERLGRLKTLLGDSVQPGMDAAEMLKAINDKVGPAAQNEMQTFGAQLERLNNMMSDIYEGGGKQIVGVLTELLSWFQALPSSVQSFAVGLVAIGTAVAPVLLSLSSLISILGTTGLGAAIGSALTALGSFLAAIGPAGWLVLAIIGLAAAVYKNWDLIVGYTKALYEGIKTWLVDKLQGLIASIQQKIDAVVGAFKGMYNALVGHSIIPDTINGIRDNFAQLDQVMVQPVAEATAQVQAHLRLMAAQMRANAILNRNSLFTTGGQLEEVAKVFDVAAGGGGGVAGGAAAVTINNTFNLVDTADNLARQVGDIIMRQVRSGTQLGTA